MTEQRHLTKQSELPEGITLDQVTCFSTSAVIINDQDQILMMMRDDCPVWILIGGLVDEGEEFEQGLRREAFEEAGVELDIIKFSCDYFSPISYEPPYLFRHGKTYLCKIRDNQTPVLGNEGISLKWFDLENLPKNIPPRYITRIEGIKKDKTRPTILTKTSTRHFVKSCPVSDMHMLEAWRKHPKVLEKKSLNKLIYWPEN